MCWFSCSRLATAIFVATSLSALVGCSDQGKYAEAYLEVRRDAFDGNVEEFRRFKETQCTLLRSTFVLSQALGSGAGNHASRIRELARDLEVKNGEDELLVLRLVIRDRKPEEAVALLDSVVETYVSEVVNRERLELVEQLSRMRMRYQACYDDIAQLSDQVNKLADLEGAPQGNSFTGTQLEVEKQHLLNLRDMQVELRLERSQIESSRAKPESDQALVTLDAKSEVLSELIAESETRLRQFTGPSGELQARKTLLEGQQRELQRLGQAKTDLEIRIDQTERVVIMQSAVVL